MRRLLFAALAAVGIHGLLFVWEFDLTVVPHRHEPEPRTLNMILISPAPQKPAVKPVEHPRNATLRAPVPPPSKKKAPKPVQPVQKPPVTPDSTERPSEESIAAPETQPQVPPQVEPVRPVPSERSGSETTASGSENLSNVVREAVPMYRSNAPPAYPRSARKRGWQGTVILEILVDVEGGAKDIRINESSGYAVLDEAAASAAKKWMFAPGMRGDAPVEMWVRVPVTFQLQ